MPPTHDDSRKLIARDNFTGCIQDLLFNSTNIIRELKTDAYRDSYTRFGDTPFECRLERFPSITFLSAPSYLKVSTLTRSALNVSLDFRTFNEDGLILYHKFISPPESFFAVSLNKRKLQIDLKLSTAESPVTLDLQPFPSRTLNDGSWHILSIRIERDLLLTTLDGELSKTKRKLSIQTGSFFHVGGGDFFRTGFIGCIRRFRIDDIFTPLDSITSLNIMQSTEGEVVANACKMIDRCHPNPCEHGGVCRQDHDDFNCDCSKTGYAGAVCRVAKHPLSCDAFRIEHNITTGGDRTIMIDVDGSGPLEPFQVFCKFSVGGRTSTELRHKNEAPTEVIGYEEFGSYVQEILYNADFEQISVLVNKSKKCQQFIKYECQNARLLNSPYSIPKQFRPATWWMSRNNQKMAYWGDSLPESRKCKCGILGNCRDPSKWCNCDSVRAPGEWETDEGLLREKEFLPVRSIHVGDTSNKYPQKKARYTIGPLVCDGDYLFDNVVTFRQHDSVIPVEPFEMSSSWDIYLQFKTTTEYGVLLHARGPTDFIKLTISSSKVLQFTFDSGHGNQKIEIQSASKLNDDKWHSVSVEWNRKEARLVLDGKQMGYSTNKGLNFRPMKFTSKVMIGASVEEKEGYVGCIRALSFNGEFIDLVNLARTGYHGRPLYGVSPGCVGKCHSNPCLNNGTCYERYSGYVCDCQWTAFRGRICADEIGVNLRSDNYIKYDFDMPLSTLEESIRVGFTTTENRGMILGVSSHTGEYMNLMMSTSGHLRLVFDFGFERQEIIIKNENFALGQHHDVKIKRSDRGRKITISVDSYEPIIYTFSIADKADAQFNRLKSIYIGRNETMTTGQGFVGCISRISFDDHFPLRRLFQQNRRSNVQAFPTDDSVREDTCGIESVTHPPELDETRPPPLYHLHYDDSSSGPLIAVISIVIILIGVAVFAILFLSGRILGAHKGDYVTHEDKGARDALDPDMAVVKSKTGPDISKKIEYFI